MDSLLTMRVFRAVAEHGGFSAAARALGLSPPTVTRGVAELEQRFGATLFHRSTRAVALSDAGVRLLGRVRQILSDVDDAEREMRGANAEPYGQLYITAPVQFGRLHVLPAVAELLDRHPMLDVRMLLLDRNVRILEEGIDVAVRVGAQADSAIRAVKIGTVRPVIVASPAYLARHGVPTNPDQLDRHMLIGSVGPRAMSEWRIGNRLVTQSHRPRLNLNTVDSILAAAEAGAGIASLLSYQVKDSLHAGHLVEILGDGADEPLPVQLMFDAERARMPSVRAFIDAMRGRAEAVASRF